jgi:alpha-D-xyloside xylohydrolase
VIVQDWMYWKEDSWGSHEFDKTRFPDPDGWIKSIHDLNARLMISVWPKFYPTTDNYKELADKGYMFPVNPSEKDWVGRGYPYAFYDPYAPEAREIFWRQMKGKLFDKGVDAWWMDASEPDLNQPSPETLSRHQADMPKTAAGIGARVQNAYPLLSSGAVYDGQRKAAPDHRVFILTRSGFAGQQRYAAASWSGDISSTWTAMKKQIAAGLGYSISGLPYWTMDSGGFSVPGKFNARNASPEAVDEWRELNTRWFEFATFVPLLRVHGEAPYREMWQFGGEESEAYKAQLKFDRLRYRMLPYVYSVAGNVTQHDGTFMRPLVMDYPGDEMARTLSDQYMFGPAFLVSPVTEYKARKRSLYLPAGATWYDFWTGKSRHGGATVQADAPYDAMPLHVPGGSIVPFGPELQWTGEKASDPLTVYVYTGADGAFTLYEDDGLTYGYEKGAFATIPLKWNDSTNTLTIGKREGQFDGMLKERTIQVLFVTPEKPVGFSFEPSVDKTVKYDGAMVEVKK